MLSKEASLAGPHHQLAQRSPVTAHQALRPMGAFRWPVAPLAFELEPPPQHIQYLCYNPSICWSGFLTIEELQHRAGGITNKPPPSKEVGYGF